MNFISDQKFVLTVKVYFIGKNNNKTPVFSALVLLLLL